MKVIEDAARVREWTEAYRRAGLSVGFVPTMGALHEGHGELIRVSREECERVVVSIYVNPTQFDNPDDLDKYPSALEGDLEACRARGVDLVWIGRREDLLPEGFQTWVEVGSLTSPLCGAGRPGHFRGVTTVVAQLLHVVRPHRAYFGRKDFQQALVIRRMVEDLRFDLEIRRVPTVRPPDRHPRREPKNPRDETHPRAQLAQSAARRSRAADGAGDSAGAASPRGAIRGGGAKRRRAHASPPGSFRLGAPSARRVRRAPRRRHARALSGARFDP